MRFSAIRTGIVATAAAVALAACGGHSLVPSQPSGDATAPMLLVSNATTPCNSMSPKFWNFGGSCVENELTSAGLKFTLKDYKGVTFAIQIGKNNAKGKVPFIVGDATGHHDITGKFGTHSFVPYGGRACLTSAGKPGAKCPGKSFIYVEALNGGKATVTLPDTPAINVTDTNGFPAKNLCFPALLMKNGWSPTTVLGRAPSGHKLVIPAIPHTFPLPPGGIVIAMACE